jgi:uncharacterized protein
MHYYWNGTRGRKMNTKITHFYRLAKLKPLAVLLFLMPITALSETIVIYGATGNIGSKIVSEALDRGHEVIGVSRSPENITIDHANFSAVAGDAASLESMLEVIEGADAVVFSVRAYGPNNYPEETLNYRASKTFIAASRQLGDEAPRVIQLGGGSTLYTNGVMGLDARPDQQEGTPQHGLVWGHWLALQNYRATTSVEWTVVSPSGGYDQEGPRTGVFRTGGNEVLLGENGRGGGISHRDMAAAIINEIEDPKSIRKQMTVGY